MVGTGEGITDGSGVMDGDMVGGGDGGKVGVPVGS
jgi:hypothetical protein